MKTWYINKTDPGVRALSEADPKLGQLIELTGDVTFELRPDRFRSLVRSITGQLISVSAANAIFNRLCQAADDKITAEQISLLNDETILQSGFSKQKLRYLRDLQNAVLTGKLDLNGLDQANNETVIKQLTAIKGIGIWTAQMFLIFTLKRQDVLAVDDIGLQRGAHWLYQVDQSQRRDALAQKQTVWSPYCTIASIYLWEAVEKGWIKQYPSIDDVQTHEQNGLA